ncbi:hypothetical protein BKA93DRAFT_799175 [Sparassis latifolia]
MSSSASPSGITLPSLRSLGLFDIHQFRRSEAPPICKLHERNDQPTETSRNLKLNESNDLPNSKRRAVATPIVTRQNGYMRSRQSSVSSTLSTSSRETSPASVAAAPNREPNVDLVLTTWDKVDAILVVPPPAISDPLSPAPTLSSRNQGFDRPLLFVGMPGLMQLRSSIHRFGDARFHPYRMVKRERRRPATAAPAAAHV